MMRIRSLVVTSILALHAGSTLASPPFVAFESGPVRPLALSSSGSRLFAVNTPDHRLEILRVTSRGELKAHASVPVGLKPVALAVRNAREVWVTFTCVPPGSGVRMALDRDEDGVFDRDERDRGTDPDSK